MAARWSALDGDRGGDRIPTLRAFRLRLTVAALALGLAAALAAYPALRAERAVDFVAILGVAGVAACAWALATNVALLPLPLLLLAATFELHNLLQPVPGSVLAFYAAGLLLLGELINWSLGLGAVGLVDRGAVVARGAALAGVTAGATALAAITVEVSTLRLVGGLADAALGVAGVVLLLAAIASCVHSFSSPPRHDHLDEPVGDLASGAGADLRAGSPVS